ncbi:PREDICTED: ret finger protein-like 4B [Propithecus coquereli]|uniref:ret finger protein-like 4B n=1 Tax=Propithecus coquereli TaxID=379532 RepID=UPI00063F5D5C|nr:PREDICTED: ret finger protein-like 4B [Propithecus coquereli]
MATSLQEKAMCPVCLDFFSNPISLSCAHVFCFDCMQTWVSKREDSKLTCPLCRESSEKPPLEEWQIRTLTLLIKQHGPLLELSLHVRSELQRFREDMTLDAATANSLLVVSDDGRSVRCAKTHYDTMEDPRRFTHLAGVLGTPCFSSGRHYWEVEVGEVKEWSLGVCKESVDRNRKSDLSSKDGFWTISMKAGAIHANSIPESRIPASPGLQRVGIFLDVEMEEIKFFDVGNDALIYAYCPLSSLERFCPFFLLVLPGERDSGAALRIYP